MRTFYNENEPYAAEWIRNLSAGGHIAPGTIDDRSIVDVKPKDLEGHRQAHFFAGLSGWAYALRLAGWPDDGPVVWTGSCPCQPWSQAGRGKGFKDERHLWPTWFNLIRKCRPNFVFSEQVSSPDGLKWFDAVCSDLERAGYAVGAADTCAAGVGAPHLRQRLYFVAVSREQRREGERVHLRPRQPREAESEVARGGAALELAVAESEQRGARGRRQALQRAAESREPSKQPSGCGDDGNTARLVGHAGGSRSRGHAGAVPRTKARGQPEGLLARGVAHKPEFAIDPRILGDAGGKGSPLGPGPEERFGAVRYEGAASAAPGATRGAWAEAEWWLCRDGKARPAQPGSFPLADGVPARVGKLRAAGNAIVPQQAALFIRAAIEALAR